MSPLTPSLLVIGLIGCAVGGVLAARTAKWIFNRFPKTFGPTAPTVRPPVGQDTPHEVDGSKH